MRRHTLLASALLALATAASAQETVLLRIGGTVGQTNRYQTIMNMYVLGGPMAADTTQPFMRISTYATRALTAVSGDTLTMQETIDSARSESPAMPQMGAMMGQMGSRLRGQVTTMKMDGRARMYGVEVNNANMGSGGPGGGPGGPGGGRGMGGGMGRNQRAMYVLPERPVRVGETWMDSTITPGSGNDGPTNFLGSFTLDRIDNRGGVRVAVISMDGNMATSAANGPQRMSVRGQFQLDLTNNRLASFDMTATGTSNMQGQEVPIRMHLAQSLIN